MDIVVQHAELVAGPRGEGLWKIAVELHREGGDVEKVASFVPADAVEWRIAQFGVDAETALKMILLEPHASEDHQAIQLAPTRSEARALKLDTVDRVLDGGMVRYQSGKSPWKVGTAEREVLVADSGVEDPLQTIIDNSPVDDELVEVKREVMDQARARFRQRVAPLLAEQRPRTPGLQRPTPEQLRTRLMPGESLGEPESSGPTLAGSDDGDKETAPRES